MTEKNISKLDSGRPSFLEKYVKIIVVLAVIAGSSRASLVERLRRLQWP